MMEGGFLKLNLDVGSAGPFMYLLKLKSNMIYICDIGDTKSDRFSYSQLFYTAL